MKENQNIKFPWIQSNRPGKTEELRYSGSSDFFCQVIENSEGVPFQLIFGPLVGEGYYLTMGLGIMQLFNITPEDFTEKRYQEMIREIRPLSSDIPQDLAESRKKFINGEIKSYKAEVLIQTQSGEKKWIRDSALPLLDEETGQVIGAFGILIDINEKRSSYKNNNDAKTETDEHDRLKCAFVRNISHELRTPLNAIVGFSTLLVEPGHSPEQQRNFMDIITQNTDHLLEVVTEIVEIAEIEAGIVRIRKEITDPEKLLTSVYNHFREKAAEKGITLTFTFSPVMNGTSIVTDANKVIHILDNLISNALKFTEEGRVNFGIEIKERRAEFFVSDSGIGISEEYKEKIFNKFYQGDSRSSRKYEGIGLGLTIAKAYIGLLGGNLWFTTKPGEGSEFRFSIPVENRIL